MPVSRRSWDMCRHSIHHVCVPSLFHCRSSTQSTVDRPSYLAPSIVHTGTTRIDITDHSSPPTSRPSIVNGRWTMDSGRWMRVHNEVVRVKEGIRAYITLRNHLYKSTAQININQNQNIQRLAFICRQNTALVIDLPPIDLSQNGILHR
jgi:hypothetical protein